jgi:hypothetical protein
MVLPQSFGLAFGPEFPILAALAATIFREIP